MDQPGSEGKFWPAFAVVSLGLLLLAIMRWSFAHPFGVHWDESLYLNEAHIDVLRLHSRMLLTLAKRLLIDDTGRPPAYRLLTLPFSTLFGFHTVTARMVTLACSALSCGFIYRSTRIFAGHSASFLAVLLFALSPEVVSVSAVFSTDSPLYLAIAATFYFVFAFWSNPKERPHAWIGLGFSLSLGLLSKTTFVLVAGPVFAFWLVVEFFGNWGLPSLLSQWKAGLLAFVLAAPWWLLNLRNAMAYAKYARGFERHSLGPPSLGTWMRWLNTIFQGLLGHGVSILILLVLAAFLLKTVRENDSALQPLQKAALIACLCAAAPMVLVQLSGTNHLLRYLSPPLIPLAIGVGILIDKLAWGRSWVTGTVSFALLSAQLLMLLAPVAFPNTEPVNLGFVTGAVPWRALSRFEQWDWSPVRDVADRCGIQSPKIAFLGSGREFNPAAMQFPFLDRPAKPHIIVEAPLVKWLWRYEDGTIDWQKVLAVAHQNDLVLTAPNYVGEVRNKEDLDNQHNREFVERLSQDPAFQGPARFQVGNLGTVEIDLFVKKSLGCSAEQPARVTP